MLPNTDWFVTYRHREHHFKEDTMSDKEILAQEESPLGRIVITDAQVELIKHTVAIGATDDELKLFFFECRRRGVHPMDRLIHFVKRGQGADARATFQAGIDFMRSQAEASGEYRGQEDIEYGEMHKISGTEVLAPEWAKATVKRLDPASGSIITTSATAYWDEFYPGEKMGFMWRKMPRVMLGKTAESQALRKAFPRQLSGLYSFEEMEQADIVQSPERAPISAPQEKKESISEPITPHPADGQIVISEAQAKRFYAIAKKNKASDETIKKWLLAKYGWDSTKKIAKEKYDEVCDRAQAEIFPEPGEDG